MQRYLADRGVTTSLHGPDANRPNVVGRITLGSGPNIVFNGHMETLPVGDAAEWTHRPFDAEIADGRIYGPRARCMKGGISALIVAALAVRDAAPKSRGSITLTFVSDEVNGGGVGTGFVVDHVPEAKADVALVGEGGPWVNFAHKGPVFIRFETKGQMGHGAYGWALRSATHEMLALLGELRALESMTVATPPDIRALFEQSRAFADGEYGRGPTDALMRVSVNVGTMHGGRKVNVIADTCTADVDFRVPHGMIVDTLLDRVNEIVRRHPGATSRVLWGNGPTVSDTTHPWFQLLRRNSAEIFGRPHEFGCSHGYTDARFFRTKGVPAAAIAPEGRNVGGLDEWVGIASLLKTAQLHAVSAHDFLATAR